MQFRWASASQVGTSHLRNRTKKQDCIRCFQIGSGADAVLCTIVCDGAGSAEYGGPGAAIVCRALSGAVRDHFRRDQNLPDDELVWKWVDQARDLLGSVSKRMEVRRQSFSSTLVMLLVSRESVLSIHIGDGAIIARDQLGVWQALSWPEHGEYASTTHFVTDDPTPKIRISRVPGSFNAYAVFSDGIENLALNFAEGVPHAPFFNTMIRAVDSTPGRGKHHGLSAALATYLQSDRICERTDDDKSLVLVSVR